MIEELDDSCERACQPVHCLIPLKEHQLTLLHKVKQLELGNIDIGDNRFMETSIGVIGDKVGAGKSYVILALIMSTPEFRLKNEFVTYSSYGNDSINIRKTSKKSKIAGNVIVIPHNISNQWVNYIESLIDMKKSKLKWELFNRAKQLDKITKESIRELDIILVTSTQYRDFTEHPVVQTQKFSRIFYDEADNIKLPSCNVVRTCFTWFVTASIDNLLHPNGQVVFSEATRRYIEKVKGLRGTSGYIRNTWSSLAKQCYGANSSMISHYIIAKNKDLFVENSLELPTINYTNVICRTSIVINILHKFVGENVMKALHGDDYKRAIEYISGNHKSTEDNIINVLIAKLNHQLHNIIAKIDYVSRLHYDVEATKATELATLEKEKESTESKITEITRRVKEAEFCPICFDDFKNKTILNCCQNAFCFKCLSIWLVKNCNCPLCKKKTTMDNIYVVSDENEASTSAPVLLSKVEQTINIIQKNPQGRYLILSEYDETLNNICTKFEEAKITCSFLKGSQSTVENIISGYKVNHVQALLINPSFYGSGMNLEMTTDIIMYHKLELEMEKQIIGRAQRLGRTAPLNVWYLLHDEEKKE